MLTTIASTTDVSAFGQMLIKEGLSFHPDDDFTDYVDYRTRQPFYNKQKAAVRNLLMGKCFVFCENAGLDIYAITNETFLLETGLDKEISLPSSLPGQ